MGGEAWWVTVHGIAELDTTKVTQHACILFVPVRRYKTDLIFQNQGVDFTVPVNHGSVQMMKLGGSRDPDNDVYVGDWF